VHAGSSSSSTSSLAALRGEVVQRLSAGQSVNSLATAVKELVENALDAGATTVEVVLHNQGKDKFSVSDNGHGVAQKLIPRMMQRHWTSKISSFEDIDRVETFGFRGEALASLCDLCPEGGVEVHTRTKEDMVGTKATFKRDGSLVGQQPMQRAVGTQVTVSGLFQTVPVRRREFERKIKEQFSKMLLLLQAYAIISNGVRISCTNVDGSMRKKRLLETAGGSNLKSNILNVFDIKLVNGLDPVEMEFPSLHEKDVAPLKLNGFVSKLGGGIGMSSGDRQFWFVNGRPINFPKGSKVVNAVWRLRDMKQKPALFLNWTIPSGNFDINLTADKREVLISDEEVLYTRLKSHFEELWKRESTTMAQSRTMPNLWKQKEKDPFTVEDNPFKNKFDSRIVADTSNLKLKRIEATEETEREKAVINVSDDDYDEEIQEPLHLNKRKRRVVEKDADSDEVEGLASGGKLNQSFPGSENFSKLIESDQDDLESDVDEGVTRKIKEQDYSKTPSPSKRFNNELFGSSQLSNKEKRDNKHKLQVDDAKPEPKHTRNSPKEEATLYNDAKIVGFPQTKRQRTGYVALRGTDLDEIRALYKKTREDRERLTAEVLSTERDKWTTQSQSATDKSDSVRNLVPSFSEDTTETTFNKADFGKVQVMGQFNLGFIIGKVRKDLFIFDQHACDEKFRFENLQRTTVMQHQQLVRPFPVELSATDAQIVRDNLDIFEFNGFSLEVDEASNQVHLTGIPHTSKAQFGAEDMRELASLLRESPPPPKGLRDQLKYVPPVLPRTRTIFASRACRSAIMIGKNLNFRKMYSVLENMTDLKQPWNCPHGRPTMRHLIGFQKLGARESSAPHPDRYLLFD